MKTRTENEKAPRRGPEAGNEWRRASMKIIVFEAENVKRLKAATIQPKPDGVTSIGGRNGQGKTTVLDTILALVKGASALPSDPLREGAEDGIASITLDNGAKVEMVLKTGRDGTVKRTIRVEGGPVDGTPQSVLDAMFGKQSLDVGAILHASDRERRDIILRTIGAEGLAGIDQEIKDVYEERRVAKRTLDARDKVLREMRSGMPGITETELDDKIKRAEDAENRLSAEINECIERVSKIKLARQREADLLSRKSILQDEIADLELRLEAKREALEEVDRGIEHAGISCGLLTEDELNQRLLGLRSDLSAAHDAIAGQKAAKADLERIEQVQSEVDCLNLDVLNLDRKLATLRAQKEQYVKSLPWPLEGMGLSQDGMDILFEDRRWDCMSGAERIRVAAAIQAAITPECRILLCDGLESLDEDSIRELNRWAVENEIQIIGTRVTSDRGAVEIFIEDGEVFSETENQPVSEEMRS